MLPATATRRLMLATIGRAAVVLAVSLSYLSYVFQFADRRFLIFGLGDWVDPYFINALLEHWYRSAMNLSDPSSPPMFFPASKTLGYSHGLVMYAPFYVPLRLFFHPFQAYTLTLFVVIETGIVCLYLFCRRLGLSLIEALAVSALFFSSQNVINGGTGVWSQRASVFLIPPVLLLLVVSARMRSQRSRLLSAGFAGFFTILMYVQDFYTAHFAMLFVIFLGAAVAVLDGRAAERIARFWKIQPRSGQLALIIVAFAAGWACAVGIFGGFELLLFGVRLRSHDWVRPAVIAAVALVSFVGLCVRRRASAPVPSSWLLALGAGAAAGALVFVWIYLGAYQEHRAFPEEDLLRQFVVRDPSSWGNPVDFVRDLTGYDTRRSFALVFVVGTLVWIPWFKVEKRIRIYCLWFVAISFVVLLIPLRLPEFSVWRVGFQRLPGFGVIRDPKRIIQVYELAAALAVAIFLTRLPVKSAGRVSMTLMVLALLATQRNPEVFGYDRPNETFDRWVAAPIDIDRGCTSFYIKGASDEYMSRPGYGIMWSLYNVDSVFVSLNHAIPTLNGYSAWVPHAWELHNPQEPSYDERVTRWIGTHHLTGVCEFDIDARTMKIRNSVMVRGHSPLVNPSHAAIGIRTAAGCPDCGITW